VQRLAKGKDALSQPWATRVFGCTLTMKKIPGYLGITCKYKKQLGREREGKVVFQYLGGKFAYRCDLFWV
jgi:hypothetical protein